MKIHIVCLANSTANGGRSLIAVQLENGIPIVNTDGPKWFKLSLGSKRKYIPVGLVIDILPGDMLELDISTIIGDETELPNIQFDPYSIRFVGKMTKEQIYSYCYCPERDLPFLSGNADQKCHVSVIECDDCQVIFNESKTTTLHTAANIRFSYKGNSHEIPVTDPWFLQGAKIDPEILDQVKTHYLVVSQPSIRRRKNVVPQVVAILS